MPPSTTPPTRPPAGEAQGLDPLAPIEHLIQWCAGATLHVLLGCLLGLVAARVMRRRHLHWSWAAVALACVLLARTAPAGTFAALVAGALTAAVRGRRWHREDLEAGADLAGIAADRRHPLDALRAGVAIASDAVRERIARRGALREASADTSVDASLVAAGHRGRWLREDELLLGTDRHGRPVSIELGGGGGGTHTLVVGATGSGKTVTQAWIATQAITHGMAAVIVDPKGDRALRDAVRRAAHAAGRRFVEWTPAGPSVYNPYARGSETEIADRALAAERYTEPHYQRQAQRYLGHATRALHRAGLEVSLAGLVRMLDPAQLEALVRDLSLPDAQAIHDYLDSLTTRQRSDLAGVRDRLAIMAESDVGGWLDPGTPGAERFDLLAALDERAVVYFALQADSRPLLAQMLGGAIVQDLLGAISSLQTRPVPALVLIDEFSALAVGHVVRLFGRARSAGVNLLLGTQEVSDLRLPGREQLLDQVLGNLTTLIAHRQVVPDSAELIARLAGTRGAWSTTWNREGRGTRARVREYRIGPDEVKSLARGHAAVIGLTGHARVAVARVLAPDAGL
jgi:type IV secretory pathway TraG/TraD family ATPase VirD4